MKLKYLNDFPTMCIHGIVLSTEYGCLNEFYVAITIESVILD